MKFGCSRCGIGVKVVAGLLSSNKTYFRENTASLSGESSVVNVFHRRGLSSFKKALPERVKIIFLTVVVIDIRASREKKALGALRYDLTWWSWVKFAMEAKPRRLQITRASASKLRYLV